MLGAERPDGRSPRLDGRVAVAGGLGEDEDSRPRGGACRLLRRRLCRDGTHRHGEDKRRALVCFTATAPKADAAQLEPLFDRMLAGIRFGEAGPAEEPA